MRRVDNDIIPDCDKFTLFNDLMRREECLTGPSVDVDGKIRENRIRSIYEGTNLKFTNLNRIIDEARDCEDEAEDFMDVYGGKIVQKWKQGQNA